MWLAAFGEERVATSVVDVVFAGFVFLATAKAEAEAGVVAVDAGGCTILIQSSARAKKPRPRGHEK